jgi:hypothetical protein
MSPEARAARERKQKIFVAVGGLFLLALLAFQLPKILGGSGSTAAPATETTITTTDANGVAVEVPPVDTAVPVAVRLTDTDRPARPGPGQLRSLGTFSRKDPFVQQLVSPDSPSDEGTSGGGGSGQPGKGDAPGAGTKQPANPQTKGFTVGGTAAATATVISVNGERQTLVPGAAFPEQDPVFVLVGEQPGSKSVVIGVAGGAYASGDRTTRLRVGRPLVLVNTATGARYRLVLVAVGNGTARAATPERSEPAAPLPESP